jgi:hypothetical protein
MERPRPLIGVAAHRGNVVVVLTMALALGVVACQGSGATSSPAVGSAPSETLGPTTSVPAASASLASAPASALTTSLVTIHDPNLTLTLPVGWAEYPMATYRFLVSSFEKTSSPPTQALYTAHLKDIDDGAVRMAAGGSVGVAPVSGTMILQIDSGDPSLEAAAARLGVIEAMVGEPTTVEQRSVTLPIGTAIRRVETHAVAPGTATGAIPARTVEYIAILSDGRTLWILATGPEVATTFEALVDASVSTIQGR